MIRSLRREPLLHFLLLGACLFAAYAWMGGRAGGEGETVVITQGKIAQLAAGFERMRQRAPDPAELEELVADAVREEVYYREAKALRLDEDDTLVRRRLRQKLEFLSEDTTPAPEPTDAQLQSYLDANAKNFLPEPRLTFRHVYVNPRRDDAGDRSAALLRSLQSDAAVDADALGDPFLLGKQFEAATSGELSQLFGEEFTTALLGLPVGVWQGPVTSGLGRHLVQVQQRDIGRPPPLAAVRAGVRREWLHDWRQRENARFYDDLLKRYTVRVERPHGVADAAPSVASTRP